MTAELTRRLGVAATIDGIASVPVERPVSAQRQLSADIAISPDFDLDSAVVDDPRDRQRRVWDLIR